MIQVLASKDSPESEAFVKCVVAVTAYDYEGELDANVRKKLQEWKIGALPFAKSHCIKTANLGKSIRTAQDNKKYTDEIAELLVETGDDLKSALETIYADTNVSKPLYDLLKDCSLFLRTGSDPAWDRITTKVGLLADSTLNNAFIVEAEEQETHLKKLRSTIKKLGGKGDVLTPEQRAVAKMDKPKLYEEYYSANKAARDIAKDELRNFIRKSGKPYMSSADVDEYFRRKGMIHFLTPGFVGNVGEDGKLYTPAGKLIAGGGVSVEMNPEYHDTKNPSTYVFRATSYKGGVGRVYTHDAKIAGSNARFAKVKSLMSELNGLQSKWLKTLLSKKAPLWNRVISAMLEIIYESAARIGTDGNETAGKPTYGLSTLLVKHVKFKGTTATIQYSGKKAVLQTHVIKSSTPSSAAIVVLLKQLAEGKKPNDDLFEIDDKWITPTIVNKYFKALGSPATVHKLRHVRANEIAIPIMEECPLDDDASQEETERWFKAAMLPVGVALSHTRGVGSTNEHTSATAIANYISPELQKQFFVDRGLRVPKFVPKSD